MVTRTRFESITVGASQRFFNYGSFSRALDMPRQAYVSKLRWCFWFRTCTGDLKLVLEPHIERCAGENDDTFLARAFHEKYLAAIFLQDNFTTTPLSALATDTPLFLAKPTHIALVLLRSDRSWLAPRLACMHRTVTRTRWPMRKRTDHRWQRSPQLRPGDY